MLLMPIGSERLAVISQRLEMIGGVDDNSVSLLMTRLYPVVCVHIFVYPHIDEL